MGAMRRLRRNERATLSLNTPISVVLIAAVTTGLLAALTYLTGYTAFTPLIVTAGVLTGVMEAFSFYQSTVSGVTITLKTLGIAGLGAVYVGVQALVGASSDTVPALLAIAVLAVSYFLREISDYLSASQPATVK